MKNKFGTYWNLDLIAISLFFTFLLFSCNNTPGKKVKERNFFEEGFSDTLFLCDDSWIYIDSIPKYPKDAFGYASRFSKSELKGMIRFEDEIVYFSKEEKKVMAKALDFSTGEIFDGSFLPFGVNPVVIEKETTQANTTLFVLSELYPRIAISHIPLPDRFYLTKISSEDWIKGYMSVKFNSQTDSVEKSYICGDIDLSGKISSAIIKEISSPPVWVVLDIDLTSYSLDVENSLIKKVLVGEIYRDTSLPIFKFSNEWMDENKPIKDFYLRNQQIFIVGNQDTITLDTNLNRLR